MEASSICLLDYFLATTVLVGELESIRHIWVLLTYDKKHAVARVFMRIIAKVIRSGDRVIYGLCRVEAPRLDRQLAFGWEPDGTKTVNSDAPSSRDWTRASKDAHASINRIDNGERVPQRIIGHICCYSSPFHLLMVVDIDGVLSCWVVVVGGLDVIRVMLRLADEIGEVVMQFVLSAPVGPKSRRVVSFQLSKVPCTC